MLGAAFPFAVIRREPGLRAGPRNERGEFLARSNTRAACDRPARFRISEMMGEAQQGPIIHAERRLCRFR